MLAHLSYRIKMIFCNFMYLYQKVESITIGIVSNNNYRVNIKMRTQFQETWFTNHTMFSNFPLVTPTSYLVSRKNKI